MRRTTINILCSTGITLIILAIIATTFGAKTLFISSVFESFSANVVIHLGFLLTRKFESKYTILEYAVDMSYLITVLIIFGIIFHWFISTPIWILMIMAILIYLIGLFLSLFRMREDIKTINQMLQHRNNKHGG